MAQKLIGNAPNQVPTNGMLGDMAFLDSAYYQALQMRIQPDAEQAKLPRGGLGAFKTGPNGRPELWYNDSGTVVKYAPFDYTPVQQGGGVNQLPDKLYVGRATDGGVRVGLTTTGPSYGRIWFLGDDGITRSQDGNLNERMVVSGLSNTLFSGGQIEARAAAGTSEATVGFHIPGRAGASLGLATDGLVRLRNAAGLSTYAVDSNGGNIWSLAFGGWLTDYVNSRANERAQAWAVQEGNRAQNNAWSNMVNWAAPANVFHHNISVSNCGNNFGAVLAARKEGNTLVLQMLPGGNCYCSNG